ncbi:OmpA family protein [Anaerobranca gottschalkii]|uniref:Chemotaxis protein MotB n=1 Tax=Anaerobranca gottschalkii DSM 13577 TaxID=1120990 RepID=A0A1H9ZEF4_9FIRM|nr:OmpA family protein [Anaerobranca gottschalkii]SES79447.1 chemotaxis protein MotB [Anaerobranca gottschalkii DSM 13577]
MRRRKIQEESSSQHNWLLTYSDVITLVLCMFVMLYSFSTIDMQKFQQLVASLNQSLSGVLDGGKIIDINDLDNLPIDDDEDQDQKDQDDELLETYQQLVGLIKEYGLEDSIYVGIETKGIEIRFKDSILFDSGKADLKPSAFELLNKLTLILQKIDNEILVEGHTDNIPINTLIFPSNWELSAGRAISVVKYFVDQGISPNRLGALGYGEYRPIATNKTREGRLANRRVNIIVLRSTVN